MMTDEELEMWKKQNPKMMEQTEDKINFTDEKVCPNGSFTCALMKRLGKGKLCNKCESDKNVE